jgi:uncharacterized protein (TIGR03084 family)
MTETYDGVVSDLAAEYADLDAIVSTVDDDGWELPTPAEGWTVGDQVRHLAFSDARARLALGDPDAFEASKGVDVADAVARSVEAARAMSRLEVLARWRDERSALLALLASADPARRVPWYGPPMGVVSFATARLMETWAHGQDVVDALGVARAPTARLRHVAFIGVRAFPWSFTVHGLAVPDEAVRTELRSPDGDQWSWGPEGAANLVRGEALDFCLVVTQRRHPDDVGLSVRGPVAQAWMSVAQAYAGPPGAGRSKGGLSP